MQHWLLQKILLWFRKLFGGEDEERIRKIELRHRLEIIEIEKAQLLQQKEQADKRKQEYEDHIAKIEAEYDSYDYGEDEDE